MTQPALVQDEVAARQRYWELVRACLVAFHGQTEQQARQAVSALRARLASFVAADEHDSIYHTEPFNLACDLAGRALSLYEHRAAYAALRERRERASIAEQSAPAAAAAAAADPHHLAEYREYIHQLDANTAGRLVLDEHDQPSAIRARLIAAANAERQGIFIEQRGDTILFWLI